MVTVAPSNDGFDLITIFGRSLSSSSSTSNIVIASTAVFTSGLTTVQNTATIENISQSTEPLQMVTANDNLPLIIGCAVGGAVLLCCLVIGSFMCNTRRSKANKTTANVSMQSASSGATFSDKDIDVMPVQAPVANAYGAIPTSVDGMEYTNVPASTEYGNLSVTQPPSTEYKCVYQYPIPHFSPHQQT